MSTFADEIEARCITYGVTLQTLDERAEFATDMASVLALAIALAAYGNPDVAQSYLQALTKELPEMVEHRIAAVRETLAEGPLQ